MGPPHNTSPAVHSVYTMLVSVVLLVTLAHLSAGRDCTPPSKADCAGQNASNMKPWPCNCHKYWQCVDYDVVEYDCAPLSLIFDPLIEQCVQEENAPPCICQDTPNDTTTPAPTPSPTPMKMEIANHRHLSVTLQVTHLQFPPCPHIFLHLLKNPPQLNQLQLYQQQHLLMNVMKLGAEVMEI